MPIPKTISITGPIAPYSVTDEYPTHFAKYGHGGYREVEDANERNSIPEPRRSEGMQVYIRSTGELFILRGGIDNSNWVNIFAYLNINPEANGSIIVQDTQPENPADGTVWVDRTTGATKYWDGVGAKWMDITGGEGASDYGVF